MLDGLKGQLTFLPEETNKEAERKLLNDFIESNPDVFAKNSRAQKIISKPTEKVSTTFDFLHSLKKASKLPSSSTTNPAEPGVNPKPVDYEKSGHTPRKPDGR